MADVFLSYSRNDRNMVRAVVPLLEARGWSVFWDPSIEPGQRWDELIATELQAARCVVVCWSQNAVLSSWVKDEAASARDRQVLVPISIDGTHAPLGFRQVQTEFLDDRSGGLAGAGAERFLTAVRRMVGTEPEQDAPDEAQPKTALKYDFAGSAGTTAPLTVKVAADGSFVVDMLIECGDTFASTYAMTYLAANNPAHMKLDGVPNSGDVLVLGLNDPSPPLSLDRYERTFIKPLELAHPSSDQRSSLFAVPGYHRSAEGLVHFESLFCAAKNRAVRGIGLSFGGWQTYQNETYFALSLPHKWWIFAVDVRYGEPLDPRQFNYFSLVAEDMTSADRVVLMVPQENWLLMDFDAWREQANLQRLVALIEATGARIVTLVSGGRCEYARYLIAETGTTMLQVGGGRAYVGPTHGHPRATSVRWKAETRKVGGSATAEQPRDQRVLTVPPPQDRGQYERDLETWFIDKSGQGGARRYARLAIANLINWAQRPDGVLATAQVSRPTANVRSARVEHLYPSPAESRVAPLNNLVFSARSFSSALIFGVLYWLMTWEFYSIVERHDISAGKIDAVGIHTDYWDTAAYLPLYIIQACAVSIPFLLLFVGLYVGCFARADASTRGRLARTVSKGGLGTLHFLSHTSAMFLIGLGFVMFNNLVAPYVERTLQEAAHSELPPKPSAAMRIFREWTEPLTTRRAGQREAFGNISPNPGVRPSAPPNSAMPNTGPAEDPTLISKNIRQIMGFILYPLQMILIGGFVGGTIYGLYLSLTGLLGRRYAEASFAAFLPKGYRALIRLKFEADRMTVYPIGVKRVVPRRGWRAATDSDERAGTLSELHPDPSLKAELIEPPIVILAGVQNSGMPTTVQKASSGS